MKFLSALALLLAVGCVELSLPISAVDANVDRIIDNQREIARYVGDESPAKKLLEENNWRATSLIKPVVGQIKTHVGASPVGDVVPQNNTDVKRLRGHAQMLEKLEGEVEAAAAIPFGSMLSGGGLGAVQGHLPWFVGAALALLKLRQQKRKSQRFESQRDRYSIAINEAKAADPAAKSLLVGITEKDPILLEAYRESQIGESKNKQAMIDQMIKAIG